MKKEQKFKISRDVKFIESPSFDTDNEARSDKPINNPLVYTEV